ncbi:hypothetical protein A8C32_13475 [Flavivirga aquatica]|uniref:Uncharacterized protein n=1 Tax=Flavivirga aquatica TaxID=1849968 RepID=A0A1E5TEH8_9FLAO|nr:hypothetical protein A8C32_13475 [Flavivirga aquatica]
MGYVAYYELNIDYIIENYCVNKEKPELQCNGKCHLATQLRSNTADTTGETSYLSSFFEAFVPVYFQGYKLEFFFQEVFIFTKNNWNYNNIFSSVFNDSLDPPPQV